MLFRSAGKFTVNITAKNVVADLGGKPATKKIALTIKPKIVAVSLDNAIIGEEYGPVTFAAYPKQNITWSASGVPSGMTFNNGVLKGTPTGSAKIYKMTLKVTCNTITAQIAVPITVVMKPELTTKKLTAGTEGKKYSAKLATKGMPTSWNVTGLPDTLKFTQDNKGGGTIAGTPNAMGKYEVGITMTNAAGSTTKSLDLEIKGVAPKLTVSAPKGNAGKDYKAVITATGTKPIKITHSISETDKNKFGINSLADLGLTFSADSSGNAEITGKPTKSIKSLPVVITASNDVPGAKAAEKKVSLTIAGDKPKFITPSENAIPATVGQAFTISFTVEGTPNITFSAKGAEGFTLTSTDKTATLTGTPTKTGSTKITITAANADGKATKTITINTTEAAANANNVKDSAPLEVWAYTPAPEETAEQNAQEFTETDEIPADDPAVTLGAVRTVNSLEPGVREMLEAEGYTVAAVLPEVTVSESGLHDFDVTLSDEAETGAVLYWFAFPKDSQGSDDDEIAEFYDNAGTEIERVPEERDITVSVWLNEGVTYAPVIAVKSE